MYAYMLLHVFADTGKLGLEGHPNSLQQILVTEPRKFENLGRLERTSGQNTYQQTTKEKPVWRFVPRAEDYLL